MNEEIMNETQNNEDVTVDVFEGESCTDMTTSDCDCNYDFEENEEENKINGQAVAGLAIGAASAAVVAICYNAYRKKHPKADKPAKEKKKFHLPNIFKKKNVAVGVREPEATDEETYEEVTCIPDEETAE